MLLQSALRKREPEPAPTEGVDVTIEGANDNGVTIDPETGATIVEADDGAVIIDFNPRPKGFSEANADEADFNENLAELVDDAELGMICENLLRGIQFDELSRGEWLETRAQGIRILGTTIEAPRSSIDTTTALEGMSNVRHPLLLEAVLRFQANARGELLPADGPVKVSDKLDESEESNDLAEQLEEAMNFYLTSIATEYYPDTDRLLFMTGFGGCMFKKVYNCPIRQRPVSESIDAEDLIVSNAATDMRNSGRVTHRIIMRPSMLKRMQLAGAYRNVPIQTPTGLQPNAVDREIADAQGVNPVAQQTEDRDHTIYECYCELDIRGFEHEDEDGPTGLPLPYRVVIEKDSKQILEIRRNWREEDESCLAKLPFVKYSYVPGLGFYDLGLLHILGNTTNALTAAWRELLDAGMFANFPGFLYSKLLGRQNTNEFRVPPGGGAPIDTNGMPIGDAVMPLPYKDISVAFAQFVDQIAQTGQRVGGTAETAIGEGKQDAPVGTTLALIEQQTKVEGAVHKRLHAAQAEEFQMLKECFRENPQSFIRAMAMKGDTDWSEEKFLGALNDSSLVPVADPNTPTHMHRLMKAVALIQLNESPSFQGIMDPKKLLKRVVTMVGISDFESLLAAPHDGPAGIPPELMVKMKELDEKAKDRDAKMQLAQQQDANEQRQQAHEMAIQRLDSQDRERESEWDYRTARLGFAQANGDHRASITSEAIKRSTAGIQANADVEVAKLTSKAEVEAAKLTGKTEEKVAGHQVKIAGHAVEEAKHKAAGDVAKAKAAAKKPAAKPAPKKR
jgi:hypothetical protein